MKGGKVSDVLIPFYKAFPDYHVSHDIEFANETWMAGTGYLHATHHQGPYLGLAAAGKPVKMRFSAFSLVAAGKLKENFVMVDHIDTFKQVGVDLLAAIPKA